MNLYQASFTFSQEGNTLGTTEECETLTVKLEYQLPEKARDCFVVLETKGWSIENAEEIKTIVQRCIEAAVVASMTKEISLTRGQVTLVDYEFLLNFGHWCEQINLKTSYARTKINGTDAPFHCWKSYRLFQR